MDEPTARRVERLRVFLITEGFDAHVIEVVMAVCRAMLDDA